MEESHPVKEDIEMSPSVVTSQPSVKTKTESGHSSIHLVHSQERDKDTINPIPHSVFKRFHYPKTGGRLGNNYLLWGNECKHAYFPLVAIAGPDWPTMVITYLAFIGITIFDCYVAMKNTSSNVFIYAFIGIAAVLFWILLTTTLSNPGIAFRGQAIDPSTPVTSECRFCEIQRVKGTCHCSICNVCYRDLDHHCPWMGKCIAEKNLVLFYISVGSFFFLALGSCGIVILTTLFEVTKE
ncbi:hypothetical protein WA171_001273 [Blastocystis sp. BT1]